MIKSIKTALVTLLVFACSLVSCKKDWLDVNYNPRELTNNNVTPDLLLAPVLESGTGIPADFELLANWMGYWSTPALSSSIDLTSYNHIYYEYGAGPNIQFLEEKSISLGQDFYTGIAKVVRAINWSRTVDEVSDIPYSEAYKASILRPKYDNGKSIYEDLMKQLTQASVLITNADMAKNINISKADIMFHGNKAKWLIFINTLKLRLLIHQANLPDRADYITAEIKSIQSQGSGFLPSGTDAGVNPGYGLATRLNPYFGFYSSANNRGGVRGDPFSGINSVDFAHANEFALNLLKADADPRIGFIYSSVDALVPSGGSEPINQPAPNNFKGSRFGLAINNFTYPYQNRRYISAVGGSRNIGVVSDTCAGIIKGNNMDAWAMTSVESSFLQAEAIFRGWIPGDKELAYKAAVKESFRWLNAGKSKANPGLSDAIFERWYNQQVSIGNPRVSWAAAPDKYKLIMYQKYIAMNGIDPLETWTDYRRNGRFPDCPVSVDPNRFGNTIPLRMTYSSDEYITNPVNLEALGTINIFTGKIWWMP